MTTRTGQEWIDEDGRKVISLWICNTGPPLQFMPMDINLKFYFDVDDHLTDYVIVEESRF